MKNLPVQSLQFESIKANLKDFLKNNSAYTDYNFEGSGISTQINILAYQTHYIGYFVKMLLDEAFVDSAHTREALLSHAKRTGYIPKGRMSAQASVELKVYTNLTDEPVNQFLEVPRGATFVAANNQQDQRVFTVLDGSTIYRREVAGQDVTYTSEPISISEGTLQTWNFKADSSVINQRFIIRDDTIDVGSIRVRVKENELASNWEEFTLASVVTDLDATSNIFFVSTDEHGNYQIFFGNGVFGVQPDNGNFIEVTYVSSNGETGNGARIFNFNPIGAGALAGYDDFSVTTLSNSAGGRERETVEELRFSVPNHWRRQNRLVTASDFRSILISEFRNIDSMNVWGGETNARRDYGKVYVSIKPRNADRLTALAREQIRDGIVKQYGVVGVDIVFVDPDFINVDVTVNAKLDLRKTSKTLPEMVNLINDRVTEFNQTQLSKFDAVLSDLNLLNHIKQGDTSFISVYTNKVLNKNYLHLHNSTSSQEVSFVNALRPSTLSSTSVTVAGSTLVMGDDGQGKVNLYTPSGSFHSQIGTINYATGLIIYSLPESARVTGFELSTYGRLTLSVKPESPDITTSMNNIVRISKVKVITG